MHKCFSSLHFITFAEFPLAKASHMAKTHINVGGDSARLCIQGDMILGGRLLLTIYHIYLNQVFECPRVLSIVSVLFSACHLHDFRHTPSLRVGTIAALSSKNHFLSFPPRGKKVFFPLILF